MLEHVLQRTVTFGQSLNKGRRGELNTLYVEKWENVAGDVQSKGGTTITFALKPEDRADFEKHVQNMKFNDAAINNEGLEAEHIGEVDAVIEFAKQRQVDSRYRG